jgi:hypothetical protein
MGFSINSVSVLTDKEIRERCTGDKPLLKDAINFDFQLQPYVFDLTIRKITRMKGDATVGGPYKCCIADEEEVNLVEEWYCTAVVLLDSFKGTHSKKEELSVYQQIY